MEKAIKWQIPFASLSGTLYRIDIYAEGYSGDPIQLTAGETPFVTDEDSSEDFFAPIRTQTGSIQVCTRKPDGTMLTLEEILPANNIDYSVFVLSIASDNTETIEWQGFLSSEAYSQSYTAIPENITLPVISVLEAMKSVEISSYWFNQTAGEKIGNFIMGLLYQIYQDTDIQLHSVFSQASEDICNKYIFVSQFFNYETNEASGELTYIFKNTFIYDILERICKFMGWCLREQGDTFYFIRNWTDELGITTVNMEDLEWMGIDHQRNIRQGAKRVSVDANITDFETHIDMPECPITGLNTKNIYPANTSWWWYYDKCTRTNVLNFTSADISKAFLARFYGIRQDSTMPWNTLYFDIGFNNAIYLNGQAYSDTSYSNICTIRSAIEFSCICGVQHTIEDAGHFVLRIKDETAAKLEVDGYIRCGLKFLNRYYSGVSGTLWNNNPASSFKVTMSKGSGEIEIPIPKISSVYTFASSYIEVYLYNDFNNTKTSAVISDVSIEYVPPFRKYRDPQKTNRYLQNISNEYRDEISVSLKLASNFANRNGLSHIYGVKRYTYGQEYVDYLEPITTITYNLAGGETEARRPEVDLLNRLASYYGAARQTLDLIVKHPTAAPLPLLKLNGINDGKKYLPLSESRDWRTDECTITCFETPE